MTEWNRWEYLQLRSESRFSGFYKQQSSSERHSGSRQKCNVCAPRRNRAGCAHKLHSHQRGLARAKVPAVNHINAQSTLRLFKSHRGQFFFSSLAKDINVVLTCIQWVSVPSLFGPAFTGGSCSLARQRTISRKETKLSMTLHLRKIENNSSKIICH